MKIEQEHRDAGAPEPDVVAIEDQMTRKAFLGAVGVVAASAALAGCGDGGKPAATARQTPAAPPLIKRRRPNILLIVTDQQRARIDLPAGLSLPHHDALMDRSVSSTNFHVTTAPCSPSRSVIYSGQHTKYTKILGNPGTPQWKNQSPALPTLGHMFRTHGYHTAYKGKWHLSVSKETLGLQRGRIYQEATDALEPYGFSEFSVTGDRLGGAWSGFVGDREIAGEAAQWLCTRGREIAEDKPWFLAVNLVNPHDIMFFNAGGAQDRTRIVKNLLQPLRAAPQIWPYNEDLGISLPASFRDDLSRKPWAHRAFSEANSAVFGEIGDEGRWYALQNYYLNCLRDVDQYLKVVLDGLEASGMADNTIVVFTSDHGEMGAAHGLREKGPMVYRENVRVPFAVHHPDIVQGRETSALGSALDLAPTLLSLAGVNASDRAEHHPQLRGVDLSPTIGRQGGRSARDDRGMLFYFGVLVWTDPGYTRAALSGYKRGGALGSFAAVARTGRLQPGKSGRGLFRGYYDGRYKFARYFSQDDHQTPTDWASLSGRNDLELYDTAIDPDEMRNLAIDPHAWSSLMLDLNARLNRALKDELLPGDQDDGSEFK